MGKILKALVKPIFKGLSNFLQNFHTFADIFMIVKGQILKNYLGSHCKDTRSLDFDVLLSSGE